MQGLVDRSVWGTQYIDSLDMYIRDAGTQSKSGERQEQEEEKYRTLLKCLNKCHAKGIVFL